MSNDAYRESARNDTTALELVVKEYIPQKCLDCGHMHADNRKNQAQFVCVKRGPSMNADLNASLNIKTAGLAVLACGVDQKIH